jgi:uncharacterized membrane protein
MRVAELPGAGWAWSIVAGRPRLFIGLLCGLVAYLLVPSGHRSPARAIVAWDVGVTVFLTLVAILFLSEHQDRMAKDAERQQEAEWTIFTLTVAGVTMSLIAIFHEFAASKDV